MSEISDWVKRNTHDSFYLWHVEVPLQWPPSLPVLVDTLWIKQMFPAIYDLFTWSAINTSQNCPTDCLSYNGLCNKNPKMCGSPSQGHFGKVGWGFDTWSLEGLVPHRVTIFDGLQCTTLTWAKFVLIHRSYFYAQLGCSFTLFCLPSLPANHKHTFTYKVTTSHSQALPRKSDTNGNKT